MLCYVMLHYVILYIADGNQTKRSNTVKEAANASRNTALIKHRIRHRTSGTECKSATVPPARNAIPAGAGNPYNKQNKHNRNVFRTS